jgi:hypothetical protein
MGHVTRMEETKMHIEFWWRNLKEGDHLQDLGLEGRIILKVDVVGDRSSGFYQ